jgi:hypothetical protein
MSVRATFSHLIKCCARWLAFPVCDHQLDLQTTTRVAARTSLLAKEADYAFPSLVNYVHDGSVCKLYGSCLLSRGDGGHSRAS